MNHTFKLRNSQQVNTQFLAQGLIVLNPTGAPIYIRTGGTDTPGANQADLIVPPATYATLPISPSQNFGFALGTTVLPTQLGDFATVTLTDEHLEPAFTNVNLPQVVFNTQLVVRAGNILAGANSTFYTPTAGKNVSLFQVWGSLESLNPIVVTLRKSDASQDLAHWQYDAPGGLGTVNIRQPIPPLTFQPNPIILGVDIGLNLANGGASTLFPHLFCTVAEF